MASWREISARRALDLDAGIAEGASRPGGSSVSTRLGLEGRRGRVPASGLAQHELRIRPSALRTLPRRSRPGTIKELEELRAHKRWIRCPTIPISSSFRCCSMRGVSHEAETIVKSVRDRALNARKVHISWAASFAATGRFDQAPASFCRSRTLRLEAPTSTRRWQRVCRSRPNRGSAGDPGPPLRPRQDPRRFRPSSSR